MTMSMLRSGPAIELSSALQVPPPATQASPGLKGTQGFVACVPPSHTPGMNEVQTPPPVTQELLPLDGSQSFLSWVPPAHRPIVPCPRGNGRKLGLAVGIGVLLSGLELSVKPLKPVSSPVTVGLPPFRERSASP